MSAKFASIPLLVLSMITLAPSAHALEDNQILPGAKRINHISSGDLQGACDRSGGDFIETSEEYGCATDGGWVYCEKSSGDCVGDSSDGTEETSRPRGGMRPDVGTFQQANPQTANNPDDPPKAEPEHAGPRRAVGRAFVTR
jgi:hypothetical protein